MRKFIPIISMFLAVIIVLSCICIKIMYDRKRLQDEINDMFEYNYQALVLNMWNMSEHDYDETYTNQLNLDNTKYGSFITYVFPHTSYANNYVLNNIVLALDQASGNDAFTTMVVNHELYTKLMELNNDFSSIEIAEEAYDLLVENEDK